MSKAVRDNLVAIEAPNTEQSADGQQHEPTWQHVAERWAAIYPAGQFAGAEKADGNGMLDTVPYQVEMRGYLPSRCLPTWRLRVTQGPLAGAVLNIVGVPLQQRGGDLRLKTIAAGA